VLKPVPNSRRAWFASRRNPICSGRFRMTTCIFLSSGSISWKALGASCLAAAGLIATLLPSAYGLMANYQLHQLRQEHERLMGEQSRLELQEATLVSPERLQRLAKDEGFTDPTPDHTIYLTPKNDSSLALNRQ
jgi:cell division protein FtsL